MMEEDPATGLDRYLVGGAVRDALLGLPEGDRDYVVVGATPEVMLARGFRQVGRDFPVFLHPTTQDEYALARTERKQGMGYGGFVVHAAPTVRLEDDLARRDFTINAIARAPDGTLIDPFGGARDIQARLLRHVGPAFVEDPLRVLRAARFMARLAPLGFMIAEETRTLMQAMEASGELGTLTPERVWQEVSRALASTQPSAFLRTLRECSALVHILPEVDALYGVPQRAEYHPEVDTGIHTEMVCDMAARLQPGDAQIAFAALVHDLGKALTPAEELPKHIQHEQRGVAPVRALAERLRVPNDYKHLAVAVCREHLNVHRLDELRPMKVLELFERMDAFRQPHRVAQLACVCEADKRGRLGLEDVPYPQAHTLIRLFEVARAINARDLSDIPPGPTLGEALRRARGRAIAQARATSSLSVEGSPEALPIRDA